MKKILAVLLAVALIATLSLSAVMMVSATGAQFVVDSATATKGETKEIKISLEGNTLGIASIKLSVDFPSDLTLKSVKFDSKFTKVYTYYDADAEEDATAPAPETSYTKSSPATINWVSKSHNVVGDGTFVTIKFSISETAALGDKDITISYNPNDIFYYASGSYEDQTLKGTETNVTFGKTDGKITVVNCLHDGGTTVVPAVASTCKTAGHAAYTTCDKCSAVIEGSDAALPLDSENHEGGTHLEGAKPATCTETGYTGDTVCDGCGATITKGSDIPTTDHTLGSWLNDKTNHWKVCSECAGIFEQAAHTAGTPVQENVVAATCTHPGSYEEVVYCTVCNYEISRDTKEIPMIAHTPADKWEQSGESGHYKKCKVCGNDISESFESHDYAEKVLTEPTTESEGKKAQVCKVCGYIDESTATSIPKLISYDVEQTEGKTEDSAAVYDGNDAKAIAFKAKFGSSKLTSVKVNGKEVSSDNYTVTEENGETVVKFTDDYLKTLGNGNYTVTIVADDGIATSAFTVKNAATTTDGSTATTKSSKTGDMDIALLVFALVALMGASVLTGVVYRRKNESK